MKQKTKLSKFELFTIGSFGLTCGFNSGIRIYFDIMKNADSIFLISSRVIISILVGIFMIKVGTLIMELIGIPICVWIAKKLAGAELAEE